MFVCVKDQPWFYCDLPAHGLSPLGGVRVCASINKGVLYYLRLLHLQDWESEKDNEAPWICPSVCFIDSKPKILWRVAPFTAYSCANMGRRQSLAEDYLDFVTL